MEKFMSKKDEIEDFLKQEKLAVAGASRSRHKFGNRILQDLKAKGYTVFPINPAAAEVEGLACSPDLKGLPEKVTGVVTVTPPKQTEKIVQEAYELGITRIWMQQGSESAQAEAFCREKGITAITGECILMFAPPVRGFHGFHRWLWKVMGKLPV